MAIYYMRFDWGKVERDDRDHTAFYDILERWNKKIEAVKAIGKLPDLARSMLLTKSGMDFVCSFGDPEMLRFVGLDHGSERIDISLDHFSFNDLFGVLGDHGSMEEMLKCLRLSSFRFTDYFHCFWEGKAFHPKQLVKAEDVRTVLDFIYEEVFNSQVDNDVAKTILTNIENGDILTDDTELAKAIPPTQSRSTTLSQYSDYQYPYGFWVTQCTEYALPKTAARLKLLCAKQIAEWSATNVLNFLDSRGNMVRIRKNEDKKLFIALTQAGITTLGELMNQSEKELLAIPGIGQKKLRLIRLGLAHIELELSSWECLD